MFRRAQKLTRGVEELPRGCHGVVDDMSAVVVKTGGRDSSPLVHPVLEPVLGCFA